MVLETIYVTGLVYEKKNISFWFTVLLIAEIFMKAPPNKQQFNMVVTVANLMFHHILHFIVSLLESLSCLFFFFHSYC